MTMDGRNTTGPGLASMMAGNEDFGELSDEAGDDDLPQNEGYREVSIY